MELVVLALLRASNYVLIAVGFALVFGSLSHPQPDAQELRDARRIWSLLLYRCADRRDCGRAALASSPVQHLKLASWPSSRKISLRETSSERGDTYLTALTAEQELKLYLLTHGVYFRQSAEGLFVRMALMEAYAAWGAP